MRDQWQTGSEYHKAVVMTCPQAIRTEQATCLSIPKAFRASMNVNSGRLPASLYFAT